MGETLSDLADYFDKKIAEAEAPVLSYFEEHPFQAIVVLTAQQTVKTVTAPYPFIDGYGQMLAHPADSARGMADMFRVGSGTADAINGGPAAGVAQDLLRGVGIVGFLYGAKGGAQSGYRLAGAKRQSALLRDAPGGACVPVAASYCLRAAGAPNIDADELVKAATGKKSYELRVEDFALGRGGTRQAMEKMGIKTREVPHPTTMDELQQITAKNRGSFLLFAVKWARGGHALAAFIDAAGKFRIRDRTGKVVSSLRELESSYPGIGGAKLSGGSGNHPLLIFDRVTPMEIAGATGGLVMKVSTMLAVSRDQADIEMVVQGIESKALREAKGVVPNKLPQVSIDGLPKPTRRKPPRSDWLTGVKFRLNHLGYGAGPVVHLYDEKCQNAIRAFQRDYKLQVDAIPGPKTQAKLVDVCGY